MAMQQGVYRYKMAEEGRGVAAASLSLLILKLNCTVEIKDAALHLDHIRPCDSRRCYRDL